MKFIKSFDYISCEAKLTFNKYGDTRYKTVYGGVVSLLSIIICVFFGIYFAIQLFNKEHKKLVLSTLNSPNLSFDTTRDIPIMIRLSSSTNYAYPYPEKIYSISLNYISGAVTKQEEQSLEEQEQEQEGFTYEQIKLEKCNKEILGNFRYLFDNVSDIGTFFCVGKREKHQILNGIYGGVHPFGFYHFQFFPCNSSQRECYEKREISRILSDTYLDLRFIDYSIDNSKKESIIRPYIKSFRYMISNTIFRRILVYLKQVNYVSDEGFLFSSEKKYQFHNFESEKNEFDLRIQYAEKDTANFLTLSLLGSDTLWHYERSSLKFQDYVGQLSGIAKAVMTLAYLMNYFMANNSLMVTLYNTNTRENWNIKEKRSNNLDDSVYEFFSKKSSSKKAKDMFRLRKGKTVVQNSFDVYSMKSHPKFTKIKLKWYMKFLPLTLFKSEKANTVLLSQFSEFIYSRLNIFRIFRYFDSIHQYFDNGKGDTEIKPRKVNGISLLTGIGIKGTKISK